MMKKNLQRILKFFRVSFEKFKNPKKKHKRNLFFRNLKKIFKIFFRSLNISTQRIL